MPRERPADLGPIITASELAQHMGVDRHTIVDSWIPRGCPHARKADVRRGIAWGFRVAAVQEWRDGLEDPSAATDAGPRTPPRKDSDARRAAADAALAELELEERRGVLIRREDSVSVVADAFATVRSRVLGTAPELARTLPTISDPKERDRAATKILGDALRALVDDMAAAPEAEGGHE